MDSTDFIEFKSYTEELPHKLSKATLPTLSKYYHKLLFAFLVWYTNIMHCHAIVHFQLLVSEHTALHAVYEL